MHALRHRVLCCLLLLAACACSSGTEDAGRADPTTAVLDVGDLQLDRPVDAVIRMQPGGPGKPPDFLGAGRTVLSARHLLQAPGPRGTIDVWIMRIQEPGTGIQLCRFATERSGSGGGSCRPADEAADEDAPLVVGGSTDDQGNAIFDLSGPDDLSHYVVTVGERRLAVLPIEGEAVVALENLCGDEGTVTAWRGDVQVDEEPLSPIC